MTVLMRHDVTIFDEEIKGATLVDVIRRFSARRDIDRTTVWYRDGAGKQQHYILGRTHIPSQNQYFTILIVETCLPYQLQAWVGDSSVISGDFSVIDVFEKYLLGKMGGVEWFTTDVPYSALVDNADEAIIMGIMSRGAWRTNDGIIEVSSPDTAMQVRMMV